MISFSSSSRFRLLSLASISPPGIGAQSWGVGADFTDGCRCIPRTTRGGTPLPSRSCSRNLCAPRRAVRSCGRGSVPRSTGSSHGGVFRSAAISTTTATLPPSSFSAVRGVETLPAALGPHLSCLTTGRVHRGPASLDGDGRRGRGTTRPPASPPLLSRLYCTAYPPTSCCPAAITHSHSHQAPSSQHLSAIYFISEMQFSLVARSGRMREPSLLRWTSGPRSSPWPV